MIAVGLLPLETHVHHPRLQHSQLTLPPISEDDIATTNQDTPVVIDVLANDVDNDDDDSLAIDSVDEQSVQGGNVRIISGSSER